MLYCGHNEYDVQHVPIGLIRDEDRFRRIIGTLTVVSSLFDCSHCSILVLCVYNHCAMCFCVFCGFDFITSWSLDLYVVLV